MIKQANASPNELSFSELNASNWKSYEELMGDRGGCGGCWCMLFRLPYKQFQENKPDGNKKLMKQLVKQQKPVGLIASKEGRPIGWIAMAPREDYPKIENSRTFRRTDGDPLWSITCFFVKKEYRKSGISKQLIWGAIDFAKSKGIKVLEAYPAVPYDTNVPPPFLWVGILSSFLDCGFSIVQQKSKSRAMVRLQL